MSRVHGSFLARGPGAHDALQGPSRRNAHGLIGPLQMLDEERHGREGRRHVGGPVADVKDDWKKWERDEEERKRG